MSKLALLAATLLGAAMLAAAGCASVAIRSQDAVRADIASGDKQRLADALGTTSAQGWSALAEQAVAAGADVNGSSSDAIPPIVYAAENNRIELARWLLARGALGAPLLP